MIQFINNIISDRVAAMFEIAQSPDFFITAFPFNHDILEIQGNFLNFRDLFSNISKNFVSLGIKLNAMRLSPFKGII